MKLIDLKGKRFDRWLVKERRGSASNGAPLWFCICECGNEGLVRSSQLTRGRSKSCGCLWIDAMEKTHLRHGNARVNNRTREYRIWKGMKTRCFNPKSTGFKYWGGRGITVCERWKDSFANFLADMGPCPAGLTIERKNNDGNYEPGNCVWADYDAQVRNRRKAA